jgi:hypothetical protein
MATVLALNKTVNVPFGSFKDCLETEEFTPLEPGTIDHKFYARGVGLVQSVALRGGRERLELVTIFYRLSDSGIRNARAASRHSFLSASVN